MRTLQFSVLVFLLALAGCAVQKVEESNSGEVRISDFASGDLQHWQKQSFKGETDYRVVQLDGVPVLQADTRGTASALYRELDINLERTPYLNWRWRVDNVYDIDDPLTKSGDDYPARIYVVVKLSPFPWDTLALNYVWCNRETDLPPWKNPFSKNSVMIPVRCGEKGLGQWHQQRVNVAADFERHFGRKFDTAHGVAIMSDSDNAGGAARAYYRDIVFGQ
ncbi:DUF3047 domain-containing protein [Porticoccus sp. W117]|uniref:DUF3047 domain-containing protein n=1 Tax=Porticoccus sp. W117 TaxID=3054777 RepID=UPI00259499B6|nr:DUF3047 domain-containing protein [Porticoccus sp. W117]MDM3872648.1 DUF3047 domain-containing protein [Porticoccus sp. W117]